MTDTLPPPASLAGGPVPGAHPAAVFPPAGPDRRFSAFVIDRAVAWTLDAALVAVVWWQVGSRGHAVLGVALAAAAVLLVTAAFAALLGLRGTSPGRALMGLRVVHPEANTPIGVGRALVRSLVLALATLPTFGFGAASLAWTAVMDPGGRRRGWHDKLAGSVVVDVRPEPALPVQEGPAPRPIVNLTAMRLVPVATPERATSAPLGPMADQAPAPAPGAPTAPTPPPDPAAIVRPPAGVRREPAAGTARSATSTGPRAASSARWRLTLDTGESFVVEGLVLVGRKPEPRGGEEVRHLVPLRSADLSVSKTHAQLQVVDGSLVVMDRGSTNGSVLIRQGVSRDLPGGKPATLLDGDRVLVGDRELKVAREA